MNEQKNDSLIHKKNQRKRWFSIFGVILFLVAIIYFIYWVFYGQYYETTDDAYVSGNLVNIMAQISGKVVAIKADETDYVKQNQPLVILDDADARIALKNTESKLALTVRQVSQLYKNVEEMKAQVNLQNDQLKQAQEDLQRRQGLVVNKTITKEDLQHAQTAVDSANHSLELYKSRLAASISLIANTDLYHHPQVLQAAAEVRNAFLTLQRTVIYAPEAGYIAKRPVQIGEQITPSTVLMVLIASDQIWINANFKESQLKHFRIGQPVKVISDIYGSDVKYTGKIVGLSPGTGSTFDLLPPQNATGNWIKVVQRLPVRIALDMDQLKKHPLQLGLSVVVTVNSENRTDKKLESIPRAKIISQQAIKNSDLKAAEELVTQIIKANAENVTYTPD